MHHEWFKLADSSLAALTLKQILLNPQMEEEFESSQHGDEHNEGSVQFAML